MPKRIVILLIVLTIIFSLFTLLLLFNSPAQTGLFASTFIVEQGDSVIRVAGKLRKAGIIRSKKVFIALVKIRRLSGEIKAGEYRLDEKLKITEIVHILTEGKVVTVKFTIPEGLHRAQVAEILEREDIVPAEDFIKASQNPELLRRFGIPFESAEGFLFPDTYIVAKGLQADQIVVVMIERFLEALESVSSPDYSEDELKRIIIIASLVEREAKIDDERPIIAAVFYNRLINNKRLESCATVQYVLGKPKERLLYRDLKVDSPYNTYLHKGLPPGPIANPGIESIKAAISPADVDYLFFVSKQDGSHYFSSNYKEHLKAIDKYNRSGRIGHQIS
jgi:UPF0755 protein